MKKIVVLLFIQMFFTTVILAQVQIGSFYGLRLGMTMSEVRSALSSQGKTMEAIRDFYRVKNVKLGDIEFESLVLIFTDYKLIEATFRNYYGKANSPWEPQSDLIESDVASKASKYKSIYNEMRVNLLNKYGYPQMDSDEQAIWRTGANQLSLLYKHDNEPWQGSDAYTLFTEVKVTYKSITNVNY